MEAREVDRPTLEIDKSDYRGDIHSSLPSAIYSHLEDGDEDYREVFDIEDLNRYLSEGDETGSGFQVEDFLISSSQYDGELIVAQCITGRGKEDNFERKQVMSLKYTLMNFHPEVYERLNGSYIVAVDNAIEEARELEEEVEEEIYEEGSAEIDILVREVEEVPPSIEESTEVFWQELVG